MIAQFSVLALDALLAATLVYLFVLMQKLKSLQAHRKDMRSIVDDVVQSTESAREAITQLKSCVIDSQSAVAQHIESARQIGVRLANEMSDARNVLNDLHVARLQSASELAQLGRPSGSPEKERRLQADGLRISPLVSEELARLKALTEPQSPKTSSTPESTRLNERIASLHDAVKSLRNKVAVPT